MANNTELNPGIGGDNIDTDDLLGVKTQGVKVRLGATGVDDGFVSATQPMPENLTQVNGAPVAVGPGPAAPALRVELATDGQGRVMARQSPVTSAPSTVATIPFTEISSPVVAANPNRKSVLLFNDGDYDLLLGIGEPATLTGQKFIPGAYLTFECTGAIEAFNLIANGADVDVRVTDETY